MVVIRVNGIYKEEPAVSDEEQGKGREKQKERRRQIKINLRSSGNNET